MTRIRTKSMNAILVLCTTLLLLRSAVIHAADEPALLPAGWNPKAAADKVLGGLIRVTPTDVKGAHGSKLVMVGDRAYVATLADNTRGGESHDRDSVYSALAVVNVKTMTVERFLTTARSGQVFANETLPRGACYASNILRLDDQTLRSFFCLEQPGRGQSQMYFRDFDLRTQSFTADVHRLKLRTSSGVFDLQPQHLHSDAARHGFPKPAKDHALELLDAFKEFDGRTYAVLNSFIGGLNALTVFDEAGDTLEVVGRYNEPFDLSLTESAVNRLPDGTWMAICRQEGGTKNYVFTTSRDGRTWTKAEPGDWVPNGTNSKPTFDRFNGVYYLGWQEATKIENVGRAVFNVDVSTDCRHWERKYRFESPSSFQYPFFVEHDGAIWFTVSQAPLGGGGPDRIMFGTLEDVPQPAAAVGRTPLDTKTGQKPAPLEFAVKAGIDEFLVDPRFVPMQRLFQGRGGWGGVLTAPDGTVIAFRSPGGGTCRRSLDGGLTWSDEIVIGDDANQGNALVDETTGDVLYFNPIRRWLYRSGDAGATWTREAIKVRPDGFGLEPGKEGVAAMQCGITLGFGNRRGRLISPARIMGPRDSNAVEWRAYHYSTAIWSDDGGRVWQTSKPFPVLGTGEAALAELSDGSILYNSREHMTRGNRFLATSHDGGDLWLDARRSPDLPDGVRGTSYGCMGGMIRIPVAGHDILLFSNLDSDSGTMPAQVGGSTREGSEKVTVWASFDGGRTWPVNRLVHDGPGAYSSLAVGRTGTPSQGKIYLLFEGGPNQWDEAVQVSAFNLSWLLDGRDIATLIGKPR